MAKKVIKKVAKKVKVKKSANRKASVKDVKDIHNMVDAITSKDGSGIIVVLDSKNNKGTSCMQQVNSPEVAACLLGAIDNHVDEIMPIMIKMWMMNR